MSLGERGLRLQFVRIGSLRDCGRLGQFYPSARNSNRCSGLSSGGRRGSGLCLRRLLRFAPGDQYLECLCGRMRLVQGFVVVFLLGEFEQNRYLVPSLFEQPLSV